MINRRMNQKLLVVVSIMSFFFVALGLFFYIKNDAKSVESNYTLSFTLNEELKTTKETELRYKFLHSVEHEYFDSCSQSDNTPKFSEFKDIDFQIEFIPSTAFKDWDLNPENYPYYYLFAEYINKQEDWLSLASTEYDLVEINNIDFIKYTTGSHGCDTFYYFHKIPNHGILVIQEDQIEELDGHRGLTEEAETKLLEEFTNIPGVIIEKGKRDQVFLNTLKSLNLTKGKELIF